MKLNKTVFIFFIFITIVFWSFFSAKSASSTSTTLLIKEISYFPRDFRKNPADMWLNYEEEVIEQDLDRIKSLGVNAVRIFLASDLFGYELPDSVEVPEQCNQNLEEKLIHFLTAAQERGLNVHLNLFDIFCSKYRPFEDIDRAKRWLDYFINKFSNYDNIKIWEIQNEIWGDQFAMDFYAEIIPYVKDRIGDSKTAVSIIWMDQTDNFFVIDALKQNLGENEPKLDYYIYHYYGETENIPSIVEGLKEHTSREEIFLGEFGRSTSGEAGGCGGICVDEQEQKAYFEEYFRQAKNAGVSHFGIWELNDHTQQELSLAERRFGLYREDYSEKPAIEIIRKEFLSPIPGDANGDGRVDSEDFALLVEDYLGEPVHNTDFNGDGRVDSEDFAILQANYLK